MSLFDRGQKPLPDRVPLPSVLPTLQSVQVGAAYSAVRTGGDFFDFVESDDGVLFIVMFDIAGKRNQALEIAAEAQAELRAQVTGCLARYGNVNDALSALALALNRVIIRKCGIHNSPAFMAAFQEETSILSVVNAGHPPGLLQDENDIVELAAGGVPLGLFSHVVHEPRITVISPGTTLVVASRGIIEAKSGSHEFGLAGVKSVLAANGHRSADELCGEVVRRAEQFSTAPGFWGPRLAIPGFSDVEKNDMTCIALMRPAIGALVHASAA